MNAVRLTAVVGGRVQGVGFRWWTQSHAVALGLTGYAANQMDGTVQVVAEGDAVRVNELLSYLRSGSTPGHVGTINHEVGPATGEFVNFSTA